MLKIYRTGLLNSYFFEIYKKKRNRISQKDKLSLNNMTFLQEYFTFWTLANCLKEGENPGKIQKGESYEFR